VSGSEVPYHERQAELEFRLLVLVDQLRARIAAVAAELGLTPQQAILLRHLGQPRTMGDMACVLACDRSNVTGLVDRLAARGLVARVADDTDRRIKHLVLTAEGHALRARLQDCLFAGSPVISGLEPSERWQLLQLLRKLTPEIDETVEEPMPDLATQ
jgi:DNA-binding MarR family transcriptional regulator